MTWYKEEIQTLLPEYKGNAPYSYWNEHLFENIPIDVLKGHIDDTMTAVAVTMGTWERVVKTSQLWADSRTINAVNHAYLLSEMYLCLLYPRQTALEYIARNLGTNTSEQQICEELTKADSNFRRIRNALAHGRFELNDTGKAVDFNDGPNPNTTDWQKTIELSEIRLICLIVLDVLMSAYATTI